MATTVGYGRAEPDAPYVGSCSVDPPDIEVSVVSRTREFGTPQTRLMTYHTYYSIAGLLATYVFPKYVDFVMPTCSTAWSWARIENSSSKKKKNLLKILNRLRNITLYT